VRYQEDVKVREEAGGSLDLLRVLMSRGKSKKMTFQLPSADPTAWSHSNGATLLAKRQDSRMETFLAAAMPTSMRQSCGHLGLLHEVV